MMINDNDGNKFEIRSVKIIPGKEKQKYWKNDMQEVSTDKGVLIDKLPEHGGHDWKGEIGKTVAARIVYSSGCEWISLCGFVKSNKESSVVEQEKLPSGYDINENPELKQAYEFIKQEVPVVFLTGGAGTGKSTFIKYLKNNLKADMNKNYVVLAPTGVAAINVGGQTIHSFFKFKTDVFENEEIKKSNKNPVLDHTDLIIIDEISMVHSWMLDHVDYALRLWCDKTKPFGGKQLLLIGDCFQLPPVKNDDDVEKQHYYAQWESPFFFAAKVFDSFSKNDVKYLQLTKIYRQENDQRFIHILNRIRKCKYGFENDIDYLNKNCFIETRLGTSKVPEECLLLCTTNAKAAKFNTSKMFNLQHNGAKSKTFQASINGEFNIEHVLTPVSLEICVGAKIMVTKNINTLHLVNGDMGKVLGFGEDYVDIEVKGSKYHITRETWQSLKYQWNESSKTITQYEAGSFIQIPLQLGWAVTIHKSQGLTLDSVAIDAPDAWDSGQVYVALSRAKTIDGVLLCQKIPFSAVKVDPYVQSKYKELFLNDENDSVLAEDDYRKVLSNENFTIDETEQITTVKIGDYEFGLYPKNGEKIQEHVRTVFALLLENKLIPESEMQLLLTDKDYCYNTFGIGFKFKNYNLKLPLFVQNEKDRVDDYGKTRYWASNYSGYYICSQWYQNCADKFAHWLIKMSRG